MLSLLQRNRRLPIALDVGADSVKLLQMQNVGGSVCVSACGRWQVPYAVRAEPELLAEACAEAVRRLLREGGFRGRDAISALSCEQLHIATVRLPHLPTEKLAQAAKWEAREQFGFEPGAGLLNYIKAGQIRQGGQTRDEVILMAAAPDVIDGHLGLLKAMGLRPVRVDAGPTALFRIFRHHLRRQDDEQHVSVILDIGQAATRVVVARGRGIVFIKSIDIGTGKLTEAVAERLDLPQTEAAQLCRKASQARRDGEGNDPARTAAEASRAAAEALATEIALCLRYCSVTFRGLRPQGIFLAGGGACFPGLEALLTRQLGAELAVAEPLRGMDVSGVHLGADRRGTLAEWALCAGLAIRGLEGAKAAKRADHGKHRLSA